MLGNRELCVFIVSLYSLVDPLEKKSPGYMPYMTRSYLEEVVFTIKIKKFSLLSVLMDTDLEILGSNQIF